MIASAWGILWGCTVLELRAGVGELLLGVAVVHWLAGWGVVGGKWGGLNEDSTSRTGSCKRCEEGVQTVQRCCSGGCLAWGEAGVGPDHVLPVGSNLLEEVGLLGCAVGEGGGIKDYAL